MACAYKCDRCGKFFVRQCNTSVSLTTSSNSNKDVLINVIFDCGLNAKLDLCSDCVESFRHWWANEAVIPVTKKRGKKDGPDRQTT